VIQVGVIGVKGRMGSTVRAAVEAASDITFHAGVDIGDPLDDLGGSDVVVVFTSAGGAMDGLRWCASNGVHAVVGTTGFTEDELGELRSLFVAPLACAVVPNFAIGAVLMMRLAELCAPHFDTAELVELHHDRKIDAPSGTALATAARIGAARDGRPFAPDPTESEVLTGARGGATDFGVRVHAIRMRGMVASQEVVFGTEGQTLSIRHDTTSRDSFMPGVLLAVRNIASRPGLTIGLDPFLFDTP
jgi:4-hydroxy-tetrahydrodipicolinate reductase